jgi:hypothetical protein
MSLSFALIALAAVLLAVDLLTAPKHRDTSAGAHLKESRHAA